MIRSFRDKDDERLFRGKPSKKLPRPLQRGARRKLLMLNAAESLDDLRVPPGNRLEKLRGARKGEHQDCARLLHAAQPSRRWRWPTGHLQVISGQGARSSA